MEYPQSSQIIWIVRMGIDYTSNEHIAVAGTGRDMCVMWADVGINYTAIACREKQGEQLVWAIEHVGYSHGNPGVEIDRLRKDSNVILTTMILRRLRISCNDLNPNEYLYMIKLPYISKLDFAQKNYVDHYEKTLHIIVTVETIRRFSQRKGKTCFVKKKIYDGFYLD